MVASADNSRDNYFKSQKTDYNMGKVNYPENMLFYINKSDLSIKKG